MCNFSSVLIDKGIEKGMKDGLEKGSDLLFKVISMLRDGADETTLRREFPDDIVRKSMILK